MAHPKKYPPDYLSWMVWNEEMMRIPFPINSKTILHPASSPQNFSFEVSANGKVIRVR